MGVANLPLLQVSEARCLALVVEVFEATPLKGPTRLLDVATHEDELFLRHRMPARGVRHSGFFIETVQHVNVIQL